MMNSKRWILVGLIFLFAPSFVLAGRIDSTIISYFGTQGIEVSDSNKVRFFYSGKEKFEDMFKAIKGARHSVNLEYFNFRNDSIANLLFDILAEKAAEGVKVRALFDAFGNSSNNRPLKRRHLKSLRARGIEIYEFDPLRKFPWINHVFHRDHRKIVVIDGRIAYTGGMNVADYYVNGLEKIGTWHDRHLCVEGPVVAQLQEVFFKIWWKQTHEMIVDSSYYPKPDYAWIGDSASFVKTALVNREPRVAPKIMRNAYTYAIDNAKHKIQIVNPYFVPTHKVYSALKRAVQRGVKVEILIADKSDIPFTPEASKYKLHKLMKVGADVYIANNGFHHSKIMMIDDSVCTVGSTNLDARSLRFDYEANLFIFSKKQTTLLQQRFEADKKQSCLMTRQNWKKRSRWKRFVGWFANIFAFCI
ncbi:MAG: cardiolipin synthase [Bacteroidaceae bacterium]|nr:cardiolipin synthase [Bacteroidaceae bacterium]